MSTKRWCVLTAAMLALLAAAIILMVVIVDPYEIYHRALFYQPAYASGTQSYSNAGVAKSYDYDSIIIGTSVTENCTPSVYEAALGGRFVKLCMNGGLALDHAKMMDIAFRTHEVSCVVYGLDLFAFSQYHTNQKAISPDYLYDDNLFNDVQYWFNRSVLLTAIPDALSRLGTPDPEAARDGMYFWDPPELPGEDGLLALVDLTVLPEQSDPTGAVEFAQMNLEHNLLPYVQAHRETTFTIFFPPYSLLYWAKQAADGSLDACLAQKALLQDALLGEPNVQLFDFQMNDEWVTNYGLYFDLIHYTSPINDAMAQAMAQGRFLVTDASQVQENLRALREAVCALFP